MIATTAVLAADFRAIGLTVAVLVLIAFALLWVRNIFASRKELGSEIELAPNRKPYYDDEDLEGVKLDRSLTFALVMLAILAIAVPFYWLAEPGRQDGAINEFIRQNTNAGEELYTEGAQCVNCHAAGGAGGAAPYVLQDADGQFVANANWQAPALDDVLLRYDEDEVRYVLNFGRPGSPMAAWGTPGGGPLTTQQVEHIIQYLESIQKQSLDPIAINDENFTEQEVAEAQLAADEISEEIRAEVERSLADGEFETIGEAVFNLGFYSGFQGGSLSCARCHTSTWALGPELATDALDQGVAGCGGGDPSGIGFNLCNGATKDRFPDDTWKRADGSWMPPEGLDDDEGFYIEAADGSKVRLDDSGNPVDDNGEPYIILDEAPGTGGSNAADDSSDDSADDADDSADDDADQDAGSDDRIGDLASCEFVSGLWQPEAGPAYPYDPELEPEVDEETGSFVDPPEIEESDVPGEAIRLADNRLVGDCTIVEMPERTSQAHYDFIYSGAEAGSGYGRGGLSTAGMMPGFGALLPPEYIQAVVDYERGL